MMCLSQVACATPGLFSYIDYTKADAWAVGSIAYELLSDGGNPFYHSVSGDTLRNTTYVEADLPQLDDLVPPIIVQLVHALLARKPSQVCLDFRSKSIVLYEYYMFLLIEVQFDSSVDNLNIT